MFVARIQNYFFYWAAPAGLWWLLSGRNDGLSLTLGLLSVLFSVYLARRMAAFDRESHPFALNWRLLWFWCWLAKAIVQANLNVVRHIFARPLQITPTWLRLTTAANSEVGMALLANSITLTPGTVTLEVEDTAIAVHALTRDAAAYLQSGDMARRTQDLDSELSGVR